MRHALAALAAWFTPARRQAIYVAVGALTPILIYTRTITEGQVESVLTITSVALQGFAGILALINLNTRQVASWFITTGRAAIYAAAVLVAPAASNLGWINPETAENWLAILSMSLTALASLLAAVPPPRAASP